MFRLIASEYSTHIRANVRLYQSCEGDYKVDWRFSHGGHGARAFPVLHEALTYFRKLQPSVHLRHDQPGRLRTCMMRSGA
jgi:hypothetical protein